MKNRDLHGLRDREIAWQAQAGAQDLALRLDIFEMLQSGNRGSGKSEGMLADFLQHVGVGWGIDWRGIIFRETYPQLEDLEKKTKKMFPKVFPSAKFNINSHTWTFPDGEQLLLRHMKDPDDYNNYHGHEYPFIGWEELTNWAIPECYTRMMSCCRSSVNPAKRDKLGRGMPRKYRATTNPYGKGMNWIKKRFQLPQMMGLVIREIGEDGKEQRPRIAINFDFSENLALKESEPDYLEVVAQAARNASERLAWTKGSWDITSGGMFDDLWDSTYHIVQPFAIPPSWHIDRSFDWGSTKPASVLWWAESDGSDVKLPDGRVLATRRGDLFLIAEWYICNPKGTNEGLRMAAPDVAKGIVAREVSMKLRTKQIGVPSRAKSGPADTSIWDTDTGESIASQMTRPVLVDGITYPGIQWVRSDKTSGSRKTGAQLMRDRLKKPEKNLPRENPGIFVFNTCTNWIQHVPTIPRDLKDPDDVDSDAEDHDWDSTRYRLLAKRQVVKVGRTVGAY